MSTDSNGPDQAQSQSESGVEASESIRVTENGNELFNNFPKELHIK